MGKTDKNMKLAEDFIRLVLRKNFRQELKDEVAREAAAHLCDAVPTDVEKEVA